MDCAGCTRAGRCAGGLLASYMRVLYWTGERGEKERTSPPGQPSSAERRPPSSALSKIRPASRLPQNSSKIGLDNASGLCKIDGDGHPAAVVGWIVQGFGKELEDGKFGL